MGGIDVGDIVSKIIRTIDQKIIFIRLFDFITVGALVVLTYVMFENHIRINRMNKTIEDLVRKLSIK